MANDVSGNLALRTENFERMVKAFAAQELKMKQLVMESSSSAWVESYYRETTTELTGGAGDAVKGVPRLAAFPHAEPNWTLIQTFIEKYGCEAVVSYEDSITNNIDVIARTMLRIARAVAYAVDLQIYSVLSAGAGNSVVITAGYEWNSATIANRDPVQDLLNARREIAIDNYDPDRNGYLVINPTDYANLLGNTKVVNNPSFKAADVTANGVVGSIVGLKIIVSNVVTADEALVVIAKECGTWKSAAGLTTHVIEDKGIKYTIRSFELGVCQLVAPNCVCKISNTAA